MGMQFLIETERGRTIEAELVDCRNDYPWFYVNGEPCRLSTARSLEAEAVKEATALIQRLRGEDYCGLNEEYPELFAWLEKWGRE